MYAWHWDWTWGWLPLAGGIVVLGILVLPWFFFLLNLHTLLERVSPQNRAMPPAHVWLNFIPLFSLGWYLYTVHQVRDSVRAEYRARGWPLDQDFGYNLGLASGVLGVASFFMGWVPLIGWACSIGAFVCWIMYWLKTHEISAVLSRMAPAFGPPGATGSAGPAGDEKPSASPQAEKRAEEQETSIGGGICAACGTRYDSSDRYCRYCGLTLPRV